MELQYFFEFGPIKIVVSIAVVGFLGLLGFLYNELVMKPNTVREILIKQGINGPKPSFLLGNIREIMKKPQNNNNDKRPIFHNVAAALYPCFGQWKKKYGELFVFSLGNKQIVCVNQADVVREITKHISLDLGKISTQRMEFGPLLGQGVLTSNGKSWAHQRKIIAPELYMDKVKGMMNLITESAITLIKSWKSKIEAEGGIADIKIDASISTFSADVISRACFGSNYSEGQQIFFKLRTLREIMSKKSLLLKIPGMRFLPTKSNICVWKLEKEIYNLILKVVKKRQEAAHEKDLLQTILQNAKRSNLTQKAVEKFIVDNCKTIYLAGYDTTAASASWCLMFLASHQQWQDRVRVEVLEICGDRIPDVDMLPKMKQLTMVIQESLRLYPPVPLVTREALKDMKFNDVYIPKGVDIWVTILTLHTDPEIWGSDAYEFKPDRFANGIAGACKLPHLYMPFGYGPRICLGQNLAMVELKLLLALILSNFSFSLSPNYTHSPVYRLLIEPERGVNVLVKNL